MRLVRFWVESLPGISDRFSFTAEPGLNLITGPNGIGKSSVARALIHLLWPQTGSTETLPEVRAEFETGGRTLGASCRREHRAAWTQDGQPVAPPVLPGDHLAACYHLDILDLLPEAGHPGDDQLARHLAKELSGGVDLAATRDDLFALKGLAAGNRRADLVAARGRVATVTDQQTHLARRQDARDDLQEELAAAQLAQQRAEILQKVASRADCLARRESIRQELQGLPPGVARIQPPDPKTLAQARRDQGRRREEIAAADAELARLQEELAALGGQGNAGATGPWAALRRRVQDVRDAEGAVKEAQRRLQESAAAQQRAQAAVPTNLAQAATGDGGTGPGSPAHPVSPLTPDAVRKTFDLVGRLHQHRSKAQAYEQAMQAHARTDRGPSFSLRLALAPGLLLVALAAGLLLVPGGRLSALICGGLGLTALGIGLALRARARGRHFDPAEPGHSDAVLLDHERRALEAVRKDLGAHLDALGLPWDLEDPSIPLLLDGLRTLEKERQDHDRCLQQHAMAREQCARDLQALNHDLQEQGCAPVVGSIPAEQAVSDLEGRHARRQALAGEIEGLARRRLGLTAEVDRLEETVAGLLTDLGLEPGPQEDRLMLRLLEAKPRHDQLAAEARDLEQEVRRLERDIAAGAALFGAEPVADLPAGVAALRMKEELALAQRRDDLNQQIGALDKEIQLAQAGHDLEDALAQRAGAEEALARTYEQNLFILLGRDLLDGVREEYQTRTRPAALQAADDLLRAITGLPYELQHASETDGSGRFVVLDRESGLHFRPAELSAGTRTQLFLAVRLGFLAVAETGLHPPLILDDALLASDPLRFAAAVASLGRLAASGPRQIFYLCSHPAEVQAWDRILRQHGLAAPHVIDLAAARARASAAPQEVLGNWDPAAAAGALLPSPDGMTPAAYGAALQVPAPQPWNPPDALHLFFLLEDRLELLRRLVSAGTSTVGRWRLGATGLLQAGIVSSAEADLVSARVLVWELVLKHWQIGRARLVPSDFLEKSDALGHSRLLPKVQDLWGQVGGNARDLLAGLRDRRIPNFRTEIIDRLEGELAEGGYLATAAVLDRDALLQAVVLGFSGPIQSKILNTETIPLLVDRFLASLPESRQK